MRESHPHGTMIGLAVFLFCVSVLWPNATGQTTEKPDVSELCGLYYTVWNHHDPSETALVISPDGKPIPKKENDPEAPTEPGLHVNKVRFPFASSHITAQEFSFRTARVGDIEYSFRGKFGREQVEDTGPVPFIAGVLSELRNGRVVRKESVHFSHAVVL